MLTCGTTILVICAAALTAPQPALETDRQSEPAAAGVATGGSSRSSVKSFAGGPACGVYCVYGALRAVGLARDVPLDRLMDRRYIGSVRGSTPDELALAVEDSGGRAIALQGISAVALRAAESPVILHYSTGNRPHTFDHWVLYLGCEDGRARVVDPPSSLQTVSYAEVLAQSDGIGILVAARPVDVRMMLARSLVAVAVLVLVIVGALLLARRFAVPLLRRFGSPRAAESSASRKCVVEAAGLAVFVAIFAVAWHAVSAEGFIRNREAVSLVRRSFASAFLRRYEPEELAQMIQAKDAIVIDARFEADFQAGHIPGAISMPTNSDDARRLSTLRGIPPHSRLVVYCQSSSCRFDDEVALWLMDRGYRNIGLFPGGWVEWTAYQRKDIRLLPE